MKTLFLILSTCFLLLACKKNKIAEPIDYPVLSQPIDTTGFLDIHITNVVNGVPLALGTGSYTNAFGDSFTVSELKYYISNIKLTTVDNTVYIQKESYYLADQSLASSLELVVNKVPNANYKSISFLIGVDSARNTSGAQVGALDPALGMIWSWSTGYIMAKMEGHSPQSSNPTNKIAFHIGGFSGIYSGVKEITLLLPINAEVKKTHTPIVNINADLALWFTGDNLIDFNSLPTATNIGKNSGKIAENYKNMFQVTSVVN